MHSGLFGCDIKLGVKRAELVQKFVPRSRAGLFCNERTRSTPLDPKLTFLFILNYLGAFMTVWLPCETRCKTGKLGPKFVPRSRVGIFRNEQTRSTLLDPKLTFWCISYYLGAIGIVCCLTKLGAKQSELVQKFMPRSRVGIIRNEHTRSTPIGP